MQLIKSVVKDVEAIGLAITTKNPVAARMCRVATRKALEGAAGANQLVQSELRHAYLDHLGLGSKNS
ncbi:hypothetical protein GCM10017788_45640 [Amycolatopsis acidiphila]|nr:hypothetical protein GCM10017788_45640 [Amycolatopsis acidiphila]